MVIVLANGIVLHAVCRLLSVRIVRVVARGLSYCLLIDHSFVCLFVSCAARESCAKNLYNQYFADTALDIDQVCPDCYPVCT